MFLFLYFPLSLEFFVVFLSLFISIYFLFRFSLNNFSTFFLHLTLFFFQLTKMF